MRKNSETATSEMDENSNVRILLRALACVGVCERACVLLPWRLLRCRTFTAAATRRLYATLFSALCHVANAYADDQLMDAVVSYE